MLTKKKRRSGHGIFSSTQVTAISTPTNFVKLSDSGMGSVGEPPQANDNSVVTGANDDKQEIGEDVVAEPLVEDLHVDDADQGSPIQEPSSPPPVQSPNYQPLGSHPIQTSSDDETTAPPPPDFTRRGIHIPMRTR